MILAELDAFLDADEQYRAERGARDARDRAAVRLAERRRRRRSSSRWPDGRSLRVRGQGRPRRPHAPTARSSSSTTRPARSDDYTALSAENPCSAARASSCRSTCTRRAPRSATPTPPVEAYYWFVGRGQQPAHRLRGRRRGRRRCSSTAVRTIVDGIEAGVFVAHAAGARRRGRSCVPVLRSRRPRHRRSLARVGAQVRRARARGLPRRCRRRRGRRVTDQLALLRRAGRRRRARRDPHRARRDAVRRSGRGHRQDRGARRPRRRARRRRRRADARDRRDHVHREGGGGAARPRPATSSQEHGARRDALDDLDAAAICTLHAFAQRILTEFPIEVGLAAAHRGARRDLVARRVRGAVADVRRRAARRSRARADDPRDARGRRAARAPARGRRGARRQLGPARPVDAPPPLPPLDDRRVARRARRGVRDGGDCRADDDKLLARLGELAEYRDRLRDAFDDVERMRLLRADEAVVQRRQRRAARRTGPTSTRVRDRIVAARRAARRDRRARCSTPRSGASSPRSRACTARAVGERRAAGELEFHDLLVLARTLLRDPEHGAAARAPACASATSASSSTSSRTPTRSRSSWPRCSARAIPTTATRPWNEIARRSRAPVLRRRSRSSRSTGSGAPTSRRSSPRREHFADPRPEYLTCNFRTAPQRARRGSITCSPSSSSRIPARSPSTAPLDAGAGPARPTTAASCCSASSRTTDATRRRGAARARGRRRRRGRAARDRRAVAGPRPRDRASGAPARLGDICILLPARTSLGFLERALDDAGHPVPRRDELARVRQPRGPRPARDAARGRRPERQPRRSSPRCGRRCSGAATTTCSRTTSSTTAAGTCGCAAARVVAGRPSGRRGDAVPRRAARASACGRRRASCSNASCASARVHRGRARSAAGSATSRGACASSSTRRARSPTPRAARCATTSRGPSCRAPKARGSSKRCCPRPTTTRCASSRSTAPRASSSRSSSARARRPRRRPRGAACRCCSRPTGGCEVQARTRACRPRTSSCTNPSTSRWASTRSCGCSTSRARAPATTSSCRCTARRATSPTVEPPKWTHAELLWNAAAARAEFDAYDAPATRRDAAPAAPTRPHRR